MSKFTPLALKGREQCGTLGKGSPGKRLKTAWKTSGSEASLRGFVAGLEGQSGVSKLQDDATSWLLSKS